MKGLIGPEPAVFGGEATRREQESDEPASDDARMLPGGGGTVPGPAEAGADRPGGAGVWRGACGVGPVESRERGGAGAAGRVVAVHTPIVSRSPSAARPECYTGWVLTGGRHDAR